MRKRDHDSSGGYDRMDVLISIVCGECPKKNKNKNIEYRGFAGGRLSRPTSATRTAATSPPATTYNMQSSNVIGSNMTRLRG